MSLFQELQRRNVIRVATAYVVVAWLIIQIVETIFPAFGFSDKAVRIVVIVLGIGFVPALVGAWIYQFTPEGLKLDKDGRHAAEEPRDGLHKFDRAIIVVLVLGVSYFAIDKFVLAPDRAEIRDARVAEAAAAKALTGFYGDQSIAVLPFENLSSDPEQRHLGDGIAEEVLNLLTHIRQLRVISRSSAFALRDLNLEIPEIAERLDVAHILEGSVRKSGNRVRVTAQLIEARTDTHLWSDTYTHELGDSFQIQDDIAADVVAKLQIELLSSLPRSRHVDPEVLSLTAQAYQLHQTRPEGVGKSMYELVSRALEIDPDYIPALDLLGMAYWYVVGETDLTWEEMRAKTVEIQDRILELDPNSAYPDFYSGWNLAFDNKLEEAAAAYNRALHKDLTRPDMIRLAGYFAQHIGKLETSVRLQKYALAIDPLCHQCRRRYAEVLMFSGDYAKAQREFGRYLTASTEGWPDYTMILLLQGKAGAALAHVDSINVEVPVADHDQEWMERNVRGMRAMALYSLGEFAEAERAFDELKSMQSLDPRGLKFIVTRAAAWMGKKDLAFENLFAMAATQFRYLHRRTFSPIWQNLHDDPRWLEYREFNGTSAERLDAIVYDPDLPE